MALNATLTLQVTPLADNTVWFANKEAWNNYWKNVPASIDTLINNAIYAPVAYNNADYYTLVVDGVENYLTTKAQMDSLVAQVAALDTSYKALRNELKAAGFLLTSQ